MLKEMDKKDFSKRQKLGAGARTDAALNALVGGLATTSPPFLHVDF